MKQFFLIIILVIGSIQLKSQRLELVSNAGDYFFNSSISLTWSMGEPLTETFSANGLILTQGFQQTIDETVAITEHSSNLNFDILIKPNPVIDILYIKLIAHQSDQVQYYQVEIFSILGELIYKNNHNENIIQIDISGLKPGAYMVKASNTENAQHSTRLIQKI